MRIFLAVFPPPEVQEWAFAAAERVKRAGEAAGIAPTLISWVRRDNLHYTLSFLGELEPEGVARAGDAARDATAGQEPFHVTLGAPGAFPSAKRARTLWLGLSWGGTPFTKLAGHVEAALIRQGFKRDALPFTAHLTIGRVRDPRHDWTAALASAEKLAAAPAPPFEVRAVRVVKSTLSPKGSRYEVMAEAPFGG